MQETLKQFLDTLINWATNAGIKLIIALLVLFIGLKVAKFVTKKIMYSKAVSKVDPSVHSFLGNCIKTALYATVIVSSALIIGIPAASFVALLGTAGVAIGLALQGAFSNFAGGIMILIFRPFRVGDYIDSTGLSGTVTDISIFYTVLKTPDNKVITIPNGNLMNSSVTNYSSENTRRLDIDFAINPSSDIETIKNILLNKANEHKFTLKDPAPFARMTNKTETSMIFTLRVWCESANYWDLKFDLDESIKKALDENNVKGPRQHIEVEKY